MRGECGPKLGAALADIRAGMLVEGTTAVAAGAWARKLLDPVGKLLVGWLRTRRARTEGHQRVSAAYAELLKPNPDLYAVRAHLDAARIAGVTSRDIYRAEALLNGCLGGTTAGRRGRRAKAKKKGSRGRRARRGNRRIMGGRIELDVEEDAHLQDCRACASQWHDAAARRDLIALATYRQLIRNHVGELRDRPRRF